MQLAVSGGQILSTLGLFMSALSLVHFLSLLWSPSTDRETFILKVSFEGHIKNLSKHAGDHSVNTEACSSPHLVCLGSCVMVV